MPYVNQPAGSAAVSGVTVSGTAAAGDVPVATSSSAGSWAFPPGHEINYTAITAPVSVTDTSEATATALISPGAITFDGTAVLVEVFAPIQTPSATSATDFVVVTLFEGATQITRFGTLALGVLTSGQQLQAPIHSVFRFTPSAAAHTYKVCAFTNSVTGNPQILCGAGGTNGAPPAFVRFIKA